MVTQRCVPVSSASFAPCVQFVSVLVGVVCVCVSVCVRVRVLCFICIFILLGFVFVKEVWLAYCAPIVLHFRVVFFSRSLGGWWVANRAISMGEIRRHGCSSFFSLLPRSSLHCALSVFLAQRRSFYCCVSRCHALLPVHVLCVVSVCA